jgi:hypothetical protein
VRTGQGCRAGETAWRVQGLYLGLQQLGQPRNPTVLVGDAGTRPDAGLAPERIDRSPRGRGVGRKLVTITRQSQDRIFALTLLPLPERCGACLSFCEDSGLLNGLPLLEWVSLLLI